jgi:hypothetical protein
MKNRNASHLVSELVQEVLNTISEPYPENITDQVCLAIENRSAWLNRYRNLVKEHGKYGVNPQIGRSTLQFTHLKNLGTQAKATSSLIKTYTQLG